VCAGGFDLAYMLIALLFLVICVSAQQAYAAGNFTSSSPSQTVKILIEKAIISLHNGNAQNALSNLTVADRLLGGSTYSGAQPVLR
jgi:Tfp pilus assembly protein PilF